MSRVGMPRANSICHTSRPRFNATRLPSGEYEARHSHPVDQPRQPVCPRGQATSIERVGLRFRHIERSVVRSRYGSQPALHPKATPSATVRVRR
jgi:hypothetical protein